jgi:hypothetical protein
MPFYLLIFFLVFVTLANSQPFYIKKYTVNEGLPASIPGTGSIAAGARAFRGEPDPQP